MTPGDAFHHRAEVRRSAATSNHEQQAAKKVTVAQAQDGGTCWLTQRSCLNRTRGRAMRWLAMSRGCSGAGWLPQAGGWQPSSPGSPVTTKSSGTGSIDKTGL